MNKTLQLAACMLFFFSSIMFSQKNKHIIGVSAGISFPWEDVIYLDYDQYDVWSNNEVNPVLSVFYEYGFTEYFKMGCHMEMERNKIEIDYPFDEGITCKRFALGIHWIGQYPQNMLHAELGGFGNFAFCRSDDWDANLKGIEYGVIIGPAVTVDDFKIALHFDPTFSYLFSKD